MGGRAEDDAEAPTLAQTPGAPTERASRPEISSLGPGAMIGRYCLARRIGAGAMGVVWSAHDPQLDRGIAIKLVHPSLARGGEAAARLLREARAMAKLSHRSVITVHDAGNVDGQLFIAMELIDGTNLGTILRGRSEHQVLDWRRWLAMMLEAGKGLEAAHRSGVLHRDFKPDNVLVADSGRVAVGDFGLATLGEETFAAVLSQRADKPTGRVVDLTTTGSLLGTPAYMSPQQLRSETVDARADQFSFCVAAWEALHGSRPFSVARDSLDAVPELAAVISPTAMAWLDDQTLLYAIGTLEQPRIMRVSIAGDRFGIASEMFGLDTGWFGPMSVRGNRLFVIQMQPSPRGQIVDRGVSGTRSRDLDHASVSLGWTEDHEYLSWSRNTHRVERRSGRAIELTKATLDGEPANATNAGDVMIATMRRPAGREAIAVSRSTGEQLWRHQDGRTLAVRCAGDLHPPCYAIRVSETEDQIVTLDPKTGELGTRPILRGKAEDLAVSPDGKRLLFVGQGAAVTEIDPTGTVVQTLELPMNQLRSIAFDPRGGFLTGGTRTRNNYVVGQWRDGTWELLAQADDDILSFVRPSPDGSQVLVLARVYAPEVWQIQLATP